MLITNTPNLFLTNGLMLLRNCPIKGIFLIKYAIRTIAIIVTHVRKKPFTAPTLLSNSVK